ncbi:MAG: YggS family pyridoxal phosphate-dependent enzyme [Lachnospiraceae bacterium]|nr:YggS family pyridoxal phosphate-dependent enzyme [Lachnospiraceae bacterium]
MIRENLQEVENNIVAACERSNRNAGDVTLIAVSKTKPIAMIEEAISAGKKEFGENKAQEMKEKYDTLPKDVKWHFIGHLQTNKVKYVVGRAALIHSVDSLHLAEAIQRECEKREVQAEVLVEVNVAGEDSKFGVKPEETENLVREIAKLSRIHVCGLMTIAPFVENSEENRWIFRKLHKLSVDISSKNIDNIDMNVLSMGMTNDYEVAVEEGATHVRVGTGIFGERNYAV